MLFQMRFRMLSTLLLSLIVPAGSASADMRFNFENCYRQDSLSLSFTTSIPIEEKMMGVQK